MAQAFLKADAKQIRTAINQWAEDSCFSISPSSSNSGCPARLKLCNRFTSTKIKLQPYDNGIFITTQFYPSIFLNILLHLIIFFTFGITLLYIERIMSNFTLENFFILFPAAFLTIFILLWKASRLSRKLTKRENDFWKELSKHFDIEQFTRPEGSVYPSIFWKLLIEGLMTAMLIYLGFIFGRLLGIMLTLLCAPIGIMVLAEQLKKANPHWNWRFWVIANMGQWTFTLLAILAFIPAFSSLEVFAPLKIYKNPNPPSPISALQNSSFRNLPRRQDILEKDVRNSLMELAVDNSSKMPFSTDTLFRTNAYFVFSVTFILAYAFTTRPVWHMLNSHKTWQHEVIDQNAPCGPAVPYMPMAWQWKSPIGLKALIALHYLWGGSINWLVCIFSIDGLGYLLLGRSVIVPASMNLWSWVFASNKILFGHTIGWLISGLFVFVFSTITLLTIGTFIHRFFKSCITAIGTMRHKPNSEKIAFLENFIQNTCKKYKICKPTIYLSPKQNVVIRLRYLPIIKPIIEISRGAIELLDATELQAVIAHELGHIEQGLWKIELLKFLSSLALFPNYYLTLILNWPVREIQADAFALKVTKNPAALKNALIKISAAHMTPKSGKPAKDASLKKSWRQSIKVSIQFYWGESLFGYSHPYLSERLVVIDKPSMLAEL